MCCILTLGRYLRRNIKGKRNFLSIDNVPFGVCVCGGGSLSSNQKMQFYFPTTVGEGEEVEEEEEEEVGVGQVLTNYMIFVIHIWILVLIVLC